MTARRQILVVCEASGRVHADIMLDVRELSLAQIDRYRGWTFTMAEVRGLARDAALLASGDVYVVEMIGRPARATWDGRRRYQPEMYCRVLHTEPGRLAA